MKGSFVLVLFLAQLSGCSEDLCSIPVEEESGPRAVPIAIASVEDIAPLHEDTLVVVARPPAAPLKTELTVIRSGREERIASLAPLFLSDERPYTFHENGRWWFSTRGDEGARSVVVFVEGGETARPATVTLPGLPLVWLPVAGAEPRGLAVSVADEQPALRIDEVTPAGIKPAGRFEWWETGMERTVLSHRWSAEALGDGRFAVVAVDGPPEGMTLRLLLTGSGRAVQTALPCSVPVDYPVGTAVDGSGRLAIVGLSKAREVVAIVVEVDRPQAARCRVLSASGETAAQPPFGTPTVIWSGDGFVAAWIGADGSVRAAELGDLRAAPWIVDVGDGADVDRPLRRLAHADGEHVTFFWRGRDGSFTTRRMPRNLAGHALLTALRRWLCAPRVT